MEKAKKLKSKAMFFAGLFFIFWIEFSIATSKSSVMSDLSFYLFNAELSKAVFMCIIIMIGIARYINYFILKDSNAKYKKNTKYKKYYTYSLISECAVYSTAMFIFSNFMFKIQRHDYINHITEPIERDFLINEKIMKYIDREFIIYFVYLIIAIVLLCIFKSMCLYFKKAKSVK